MFKSGRWKGQNNKIKVMFQMQFHATQVPNIKGKGLVLALIPEDTRKPVAKLKKVPIIDGTCTWEPVYEMVKLVKDQKTETYKERIVYFNVQTGTSKLGEVGVDFANFVGITEPVQFSLPLTASNTGAILHVVIQKMQRTDERRVFEENESLLSESFGSKNQASDCSNGNSNLNRQRSSTNWSLGSLSDRSMADIFKSPQHNHTEASKDEVEVLKNLNKELVKKMEGKDIEISHLSENIDTLYARLEVERKEKEELKIHIEDMSLDYKFLLKENDDMSSTTIREYEFQIKLLEEKMMNQALESTKLLDKNDEFETYIKRLEKELEKQTREFENDVHDLMKLKIEQEERVVQAEEALKKSMLTNVAAVEKSNQELLLIKDAHKQEVQRLCDQIDQQREQIKQMSLEHEGSKENGENNYGLEEVKESKVACDVTNGKHDESSSILEQGRSNEGRCPDKELSMHLISNTDEQKVNKLLSQISSMDERNKNMESELKEMHEKYSEVSLRFAEVESERQQLVMALRNLQNGKKK